MPIDKFREATIPSELMVNMNPTAKTQFSQLMLESTSGQRAVVEFEPGSPCVGFWNVLKMTIAQDSA
ncbi:MAG: hypothetical protein DWQ35_07120 [Planctomycetota bacterium]|nr:MAG: hypothetical protein DWQ35_07120 [Planctomycetota bacterium]REK21635.1 MAG: hypothetical protein DWQ42_19200 [Planctomycetota bacterium]REK37904.1 MAG: hypothetical protein DWQ46_21450 [Planctomycetota bacterium]